MPLRNRSEIIRALAEHRSADVLGTRETVSIDFKRILYPLNVDKGKYDLCSDVAAMANAAGGILVCGFVADRTTTDVYEFASEATPVPKARLDVARHNDVLLQHVWPHVEVSFDWYPLAADKEEQGFLVIEIEPLLEHQRYAMVRRFITADGKLCEGFTIPVRHGDQTTYPAAEVLHRLMTDGHRARELAAATAPPRASGTDALDGRQLNERTEALLRSGHPAMQGQEPLLFWQSTPQQPVALLEGLYDAEGIHGLLNDPNRSIRSSGFDWTFLGGRPQVDAGALTIGERRRAVRIDPDGTVTAAALADNEMLGWAMDKAASNGVNRLNVIALTEMTLEYFRLVDEHVMPRIPGPWRHRILATRFKTPAPVKLGPGGNPSFPMTGTVREASAQEWDKTWQADGDPERDAFEALKLIYALFGIPVRSNPFVDGDRVSAEALIKVARSA